MTITVPEISQLSLKITEIANTVDCIKYLPTVANKARSKEEAEHVLEHIVAIIKCETQWGKVNADELLLINQVVLNVAFRCYYQLVRRYALAEKDIGKVLKEEFKPTSNCCFHLLYAKLLTDQCEQQQQQKQPLNAMELKHICLEAFEKAVNQNNSNILAILKTLNLLCKKYAQLELDVSLEHIYCCLQNGQCGMREETLVLFAHCCKRPKVAFVYLQVVLEFWPWTNRNKYYLLSSILDLYNLEMLLEYAQHTLQQFYAGMRLALSYKSLLAASQYLVKALSNQNAQPLLALSVEILTRGTLKEIQNFYAQWFSRIAQKDGLFELLQEQPEVARFLGDTVSCADSTENYRLILIFSMFSRQIFAASKLHFFKISTELITNCFQFELEAQLLIYKFIVDNMGSFSIEDCLEFVVAFVKQHRGVESAQYRNSMLGKMPTIINYVAKSYSKLHTMESTTLEASIKLCFQQLQELIETDIHSKRYQPKIFALQLLEILLKSLYAERVVKNAKNCSTVHNQQLGDFLITQQIFDEKKMAKQLLDLLNDPLGFDDALELIVALLQQLNYTNVEEGMEYCKNFMQRLDVDECMLSSLYVRVTMQCCQVRNIDSETLKLFEFALRTLEQSLEDFEHDAVFTCKQKHHLFGYINAMNEIILAQSRLLVAHFPDMLNLLERIVNLILKMLNLSNLQDKRDTVTAASFQDMDESLELLIHQSALAIEDHAECRKFLLMSFWLTLKACCDLATTIGCILVPQSGICASDLIMLEQCLKINVVVLTRCRHKGAIEAAGVSIGKITKGITSQLPCNASGYKLLHECLELLFENTQQVSTTRRGAGFSIMFLHIVKNEVARTRPILKGAMRNIMQHLKSADTQSIVPGNSANCDRIEALTLHYLCVLVKDTELREAMSKYHNEIVLAAIAHIEHADWTVCNAALQLFGALVPKIVGQRQATEFEAPVAWDSAEVTYAEISRQLPKTCIYILDYCNSNACKSNTATRSLILFLGFLAKVEHLRKGVELEENELLDRFRILMWRLLRHSCEKVRQLAALCFVRAHEFRCELPQMLQALGAMLYSVCNENFFEGLIFVLSEGILKLQHESKYTVDPAMMCAFLDQLRGSLMQAGGFKPQLQFKSYTLSKLLDLYFLVGIDARAPVVSELINLRSETKFDIGHDVWLQRVEQINN